MKITKVLFVLICLILVPLSSAFGQGVVLENETSTFQVLNLSEASMATINIRAIQIVNGQSEDAAIVSTTINPKSSKTFNPLHHPIDHPTNIGIGLMGDFDGAITISSDQPIAAISNIDATVMGSNTRVQASYSSPSVGAPTVNLPIIMRNHARQVFYTRFNVQNTNNLGEVTVTVTYNPSNFGKSGCTETATIPPGAAVTFNQSENECIGQDGDGRFVGAAQVTATGGNIVATVLQIGNRTLSAYTGLTEGAPIIAMPLVNVQKTASSPNGYETGISIQNLGDLSTDVTLRYQPASGIPNNATEPCEETQTIPGNGGAAVFSIRAFGTDNAGEDCPNRERFVAAAIVTRNTMTQPLVATVNQNNLGRGLGSIYTAFDVAKSSSTINFPLAMDNNGRIELSTGIAVMNVGERQTELTCEYTANRTKPSYIPEKATLTTQPGEGLIRNDDNRLSEVVNGEMRPYVGAAICSTSDGTNIVGIMNEVGINNPNSQDFLLTYEGTNN